MKRIQLLTAESKEQGTKRLIKKVAEVQKSSSLGLNIGLGRQMSTKGGIHWEVASRDIEGIRTELTMFCTQEGINVTSNEGLRINLSTGERRAMSGYPQLTFKTDIKLKVKVGTPRLDKPL